MMKRYFLALFLFFLLPSFAMAQQVGRNEEQEESSSLADAIRERLREKLVETAVFELPVGVAEENVLRDEDGQATYYKVSREAQLFKWRHRGGLPFWRDFSGTHEAVKAVFVSAKFTDWAEANSFSTDEWTELWDKFNRMEYRVEKIPAGTARAFFFNMGIGVGGDSNAWQMLDLVQWVGPDLNIEERSLEPSNYPEGWLLPTLLIDLKRGTLAVPLGCANVAWLMDLPDTQVTVEGTTPDCDGPITSKLVDTRDLDGKVVYVFEVERLNTDGEPCLNFQIETDPVLKPIKFKDRPKESVITKTVEVCKGWLDVGGEIYSLVDKNKKERLTKERVGGALKQWDSSLSDAQISLALEQMMQRYADANDGKPIWDEKVHYFWIERECDSQNYRLWLSMHEGWSWKERILGTLIGIPIGWGIGSLFCDGVRIIEKAPWIPPDNTGRPMIVEGLVSAVKWIF